MIRGFLLQSFPFKVLRRTAALVSMCSRKMQNSAIFRDIYELSYSKKSGKFWSRLLNNFIKDKPIFFWRVVFLEVGGFGTLSQVWFILHSLEELLNGIKWVYDFFLFTSAKIRQLQNALAIRHGLWHGFFTVH